ncbi:MAG: gamma-glutamyltransferase, partial [Bacteroidota bacterium]
TQFKQEYLGKLSQITNKNQADQLEQEILANRPFFRAELTGKSAVSSAHPLASQAGQTILQQGGNVVDAAVAVSFALGVVEPDASGIGGYGEMLIYLEGMKAPTCIEFLTRVPEAASLSNGALNPLPKGGPIMVNIPGNVAGMEKAWKNYGSGKVSWAEILAPAIQLAEEGYVIDASFATTLMKEQDQYLKYPSSMDLFFPNGKPLQPGDLFKNPDLAWTLKEIARGGAKAFYSGKIAEKMVKDLTSYGNVMTKQDMARYYAVERQPVSTTYRGHSIYSGPPPVSGGAYLIGQLNQLEQFDEAKLNDEEAYLHAMIEAWKMVPSGRGKIADPGLWPIDLSDFYDKDAAARRWSNCFNPMQALLPQVACKDTRNSGWGAEKILESTSNTGTTSFSVADAQGNMVAVTQTLGTWGGNFYVTPGLGFLYNDKLGSYGRNPNGFNARIPFARNVTSITPTLVFKGEGTDKKPLLTVGAAGNAWITSAVYRIVSAVVDQGLSPQAAIEQARFLVGVRRDPNSPNIIQSLSIQVENAFAPGILQKLEAKGHSFQRISNRGGLRMGYASAIQIKDGKVVAGADPRRSGQARVT